MPMSTQESDTIEPIKVAVPKEKTPWQLAMGRFGQNKVAIFGLVLIVVMVLVAIFANFISPYDPIKRDVKNRLSAPSIVHVLGTDALGRDVLSRIFYGGRVSLWVGLASVFLSLIFGVPLGLIAGFFGGAVDNIIMRIMDLILAFPGIIFAIWLVAMIGPGVNQVILANALFSMPEFSRVVRASVLSLKEVDYIQASKALGGNSIHMIISHIFPNVLAPVIIISSLSVAGAILSGASLSFLGLGAQPPTAEWGSMLSDGRPYLRSAWWLALFPGIMLTLIVLASNLAGDGLRDALDPRVAAKA
jgi:peptide/nickel transport system permease protein